MQKETYLAKKCRFFLLKLLDNINFIYQNVNKFASFVKKNIINDIFCFMIFALYITLVENKADAYNAMHLFYLILNRQ